MDTADKFHAALGICFLFLALGFAQEAFSETGLRLVASMSGMFFCAVMAVHEYQIVTCPPEDEGSTED